MSIPNAKHHVEMFHHGPSSVNHLVYLEAPVSNSVEFSFPSMPVPFNEYRHYSHNLLRSSETINITI